MNAAGFLPVPVAEIDLSAPWRDNAPTPNARGELFLLVRLHEQPLTSVLLRGLDVGDPVPGILAGMSPELRTAAREHLRQDGVDATDASDPVSGPLPTKCPRRPDGRDVSITAVVCSLGHEPQLRDTVAALLAQDHACHEVIVVDNAPHSGAVAALLRGMSDPRLTVVTEPRPGLSAARNTGLAAATGTVIAFTDDDALPDRAWLRSLADLFARHPDVACVTGLVLPAELTTPEQVWFEQFGGFAKGFQRKVWSLVDDAATARIGPPGHRGPVFPYTAGQFGSGNNMAFDTEALRAVGGFDLALGAGSKTRGGEDLDAFLSILLGGGILVYEPGAIVGHTHRADFTSLRKQLYGYGTGMSAVVAKHLLADPRSAIRVLRRLPAGLRRLLDPTSEKNAGKRADFPRELTRVELMGYARGPGLYVRSRADVRRAARTVDR